MLSLAKSIQAAYHGSQERWYIGRPVYGSGTVKEGPITRKMSSLFNKRIPFELERQTYVSLEVSGFALNLFSRAITFRFFIKNTLKGKDMICTTHLSKCKYYVRMVSSAIPLILTSARLALNSNSNCISQADHDVREEHEIGSDHNRCVHQSSGLRDLSSKNPDVTLTHNFLPVEWAVWAGHDLCAFQI